MFPGRLSVSRTIGDCEAKIKSFGGNPKCIICQPDIKVIEITDEDDFIILGCILYIKVTEFMINKITRMS